MTTTTLTDFFTSNVSAVNGGSLVTTATLLLPVTTTLLPPAITSAKFAVTSTNVSFELDSVSSGDETISKSLLVIDLIVAIAAIVFNIFVLYAVKRAPSHSMLEGYRGFLISLAFADLLIATTTVFTPIAEFLPNTHVSAFIDRCGRTIVRSFTIAAYMSALLNLAGMSFDHYIGVFYPLRYHQIMTTKHVCITVALSWLLSIVFGFFDLFGTVAHFSVQGSDSSSSSSSQSSLRSRFTEAITGGTDFEGAGESSANNASVKFDRHLNKLLINILFGPIDVMSGDMNDNDTQFDVMEDFGSDDTFSLHRTSMSRASVMSSSRRFGSSTSTVAPTPFAPSFTRRTDYSRRKNKPASFDGVSSLEEMEDILSAYATNDLNSTGLPDSLNENDTLLDETLIGFERDLNIDFDGSRFIDWCSYYTLNKQLMEFAVVILTLLVFAGLLLIYGRIFREVSSKKDASGLSRKTGKLVKTTVILLGAFFVCWIPFISFETVMVLLIRTDYIRLLKVETHQQLMIANKVLNTTLILHPLLDPLIYAVRMRVVRLRLRAVYKKTIGCGSNNLRKTSLSSRGKSSSVGTTGIRTMINKELTGVVHSRSSWPASPCVMPKRQPGPIARRERANSETRRLLIDHPPKSNTGPHNSNNNGLITFRIDEEQEPILNKNGDAQISSDRNYDNDDDTKTALPNATTVIVSPVAHQPSQSISITRPTIVIPPQEIQQHYHVKESSSPVMLFRRRFNVFTAAKPMSEDHLRRMRLFSLQESNKSNNNYFVDDDEELYPVVFHPGMQKVSTQTVVLDAVTGLPQLIADESSKHVGGGVISIDPNNLRDALNNNNRLLTQHHPAVVGTTIDVNNRPIIIGPAAANNNNSRARRLSSIYVDLLPHRTKRASLIWSSLEDLDVGGYADDDALSLSVGASTVDLPSLTMMNSTNESSLTTEFILGKVQSHTRRLFEATGGPESPLEKLVYRPPKHIVASCLLESVV